MYSDEELLTLLFKGNNPDYAFNLIVRKYQQQLYWYVRRMVIVHDDANDIVQDVFLKAWKSIGSFRGDAKLFTWLYRIATNEALTFLSKKKRRYLLSFTNLEEELTQSLEADVYYNGTDIEKKIQKAILKLPEKQRMVFTLRYYDEMKYEDMSQILGTSVGALKASYHHAVKKIEKDIHD